MPFRIGQKAPLFSLPDQDGILHSLASHRGAWVLVYFYPKDDTPGCTAEACGVRDNLPKLKKAGLVAFGISADSPASHKKFAKKYKLPFSLLSDPSKIVIKKYGAWGMKSFMGKSFQGILRTSFLIDPRGKIRKIYGKVKPAEHAEEVLRDLQEI